MLHRQWVRLIRQVLSDARRPSDTLKQDTFNSLRRFLSTAANVLRFNDTNRTSRG